MDSDLIVSFCEITGAEPSLAEKYLTVCDNNVERAITLYLENGGADLVAEAPKPVATETSTPTSMTTSTVNTNNNLSTLFGQSSLSSSNNPIYHQYINPVSSPSSLSTTAATTSSSHHMNTNRTRSEYMSRNCNNVDDDDVIMLESDEEILSDQFEVASSHLVESDFGTSSPTIRNPTRRLIEITDESSPTQIRDNPFVRIERQMLELSFTGSFQSAREYAKNEGKLLLVTVYEETEFSSFTLNRDLLSASSIRDFIKENFVFLYLSTKTTEGKRHSTFYPISVYPYLGVIEPLTGERIKIWQQLLTETEFMQEAYELIERHGSLLGRSNNKETIPSNISNDDEALNLAIAASLNEMENTAAELKEEKAVPEEASVFDSITAKEYPEPSTGNVTRIQFRLPDGSRLIRKFLKETDVRVIYEHLKSVHQQPFELKSFREDLIAKLDQSIDQAGLVNGTINIEFDV